MRPQSSVDLLEACPRCTTKRYLICPVLSQRNAPNPVGPGFPFEAQSKFILQKPRRGKYQVDGLKEMDL
jgi:hypothetical protein